MLNIEKKPNFIKTISKIKDNSQKEQVKKLIKKIIENPKVGKPMRYGRKGTRELYFKPFRLSYSYIKQENKVVFLELYHKKKQ